MSGNPAQQRVRRRVRFLGRVQGVFFRATAVDFAQRYDLVGYVRNLPDGSVELEAEGLPEEIDSLLEDVRRHFRGNITDTQTAELPSRGDEARFEVRY